MTIISGRNYDVLVAQRVDPWREIQTPTDAAWALRQSCQNFELPYSGDVDSMFIEFALGSMDRDVRSGLRVGCAQPQREITHDQYWQQIQHLAVAARRPDADVPDMAEKHPFTKHEDWAADVHRHTAHPLAMDRGLADKFYWSREDGEEVSLTQFLKDSARASMLADTLDQAHSMVPHYRPNGVVSMDHDALLRSGWRRAPCSDIGAVRAIMKRSGIDGVYICYVHPRLRQYIARVYDFQSGTLLLEGTGGDELAALYDLDRSAFRRMAPDVPGFLENNRLCSTRNNARKYPCVLRRLDDFADTSEWNDQNDSVAFRIGDSYYHLFIAPTVDELRDAAAERVRSEGFDTLAEVLGLDEDATDAEIDERLLAYREFARFQLNRGADAEDAYQGDAILETESEADLLRVIGDEMVRARRQALGMAP